MSINSKQNLIGSLSSKIKIAGKLAIGSFAEDTTQTFLLVDEAGNEIPAVFVDEEVEITATPNDIRLGTTAITGDGVVVGEKEIPAYTMTEGTSLVLPGKKLQINLYSDVCNYTKLQAIICAWNTNMYNSVSAEHVVIDDKLYDVRSAEVRSVISVDNSTQSINLGIVNNSNNRVLIRYITYKED